MKIKLICLLLITLVFLTACGGVLGSDQLDLSGTTWKLISYGGKLPIEGKSMTANFDGKEISGSASCNHYFGEYQIKGNQLRIEGLGWTEMACMDPEGIMEQEQAVMGMLSNSDTFAIQGDRLEIKTTTGESLIFEKANLVE